MKNVFIISGAAGSGKDSIIDRLAQELPIERIITTTTRRPRPGESEGNPYYFLSSEKFEQGIEEAKFIEHSINENGGRYGVTKSELQRITDTGSIAIWRVDWKGVVNIKKIYPEIPAIYISASLEILEARLRARDKGKDEIYFKERMDYTREWLKHLDIYDYTIENEEGRLNEAVERVKTIIESRFEK
ncbi:MAG: guanylate kinase [Undibacterium sp.]